MSSPLSSKNNLSNATCCCIYHREHSFFMQSCEQRQLLSLYKTKVSCQKGDMHCAWLQRIMGVKYSFPTNLHISRECLDMMSKIFVGNPANRISIAGIKSHPWFTKNLPDELKVDTLLWLCVVLRQYRHLLACQQQCLVCCVADKHLAIYGMSPVCELKQECCMTHEQSSWRVSGSAGVAVLTSLPDSCL